MLGVGNACWSLSRPHSLWPLESSQNPAQARLTALLTRLVTAVTLCATNGIIHPASEPFTLPAHGPHGKVRQARPLAPPAAQRRPLRAPPALSNGRSPPRRSRLLPRAPRQRGRREAQGAAAAAGGPRPLSSDGPCPTSWSERRCTATQAPPRRPSKQTRASRRRPAGTARAFERGSRAARRNRRPQRNGASCGGFGQSR